MSNVEEMKAAIIAAEDRAEKIRKKLEERMKKIDEQFHGELIKEHEELLDKALDEVAKKIQ